MERVLLIVLFNFPSTRAGRSRSRRLCGSRIHIMGRGRIFPVAATFIEIRLVFTDEMLVWDIPLALPPIPCPVTFCDSPHKSHRFRSSGAG